jgi:hypothetical protein
VAMTCEPRAPIRAEGGSRCFPGAFVGQGREALRTPMDDPSNMFRFAVGVFYESGALASALDELGNGAILAETCLIGTPVAMQDFAASSETVRSRAGSLSVVAADVAALELMATDGQLLHALLDYGRPSSDGVNAKHGWLLADLFRGLAEHLRSGAIALFVSAPDFSRQRRASRVLLRHTAHTVQTHELKASHLGTPKGDGEMPRV